MTINQAHNYIKLEVDKTSSLELPAFESEEIDYMLDDSILTYEKTRYSGNNVKKESFEESQKRTDDLRTLIVESPLISSPGTTGAYSYSLVFDLPTDYLFSLREEAEIEYTNSAGTLITLRLPVTPTNHDKVNKKLKDPFSENRLRLGEAQPLRLFVEDQIVLIGDGNYIINGVYISYLRTPTKMADVVDRDSEYTDLSDQAMFEVVKLTATKMLENIESPRYQSHYMEDTKAE